MHAKDMRIKSVLFRNKRVKLVVVITLVAAMALSASAKDKKLSADLEDKNASVAMDVIVQFTTVPSQKHYDKVNNHGGVVQRDLSVVKSLHVSMTPAQAAELAKDPDVAYISPDRELKGHMNNAAQAVNAPYAVTGPELQQHSHSGD